MTNKGYGRQQKSDYEKATRKIIEVLTDGKRHRYNDLLKETGLSTATLTRHLKELKGIVLKYVDDKSGVYPYPVYYSLKRSLSQIDNFIKKTMENVENAENNFRNTLNTPSA